MDRIRQVLSTLALGEEQQLTALSELKQAIEEFQHHLPPEVRQARKDLKALSVALTATTQALDDLSPQALSIFCKELDGPRGGVSQFVKRIQTVADRASEIAMGLPNKVPGVARNVLAYQVANVLNAYGLPPAITRDGDENITGERGGAAYARLLRCTLAVAGEPPPTDLRPLMEIGLAILSDPRGDGGV